MKAFKQKFLSIIALGAMILLMPGLSCAKPAKYAFLFIGDGMGISQRVAASQYAQKQLIVDTFPAQGITTTMAKNRFITGSAAAATAMACGMKTTIGVVGMDSDLVPLKTIAEMAREKKMKVGIVSSVSIDHATPAAFYAHVPKRGNYYDIEVALAASGYDYFAGGGFKDPDNKKNNSKEFKGNALDLAKKNGYKVVNTKDAFENLSQKDGKVIAINGWLQDDKALPYDMDTHSDDISLAEFTEKGIDLLDNDKGFFMMVEGGKIDWACHANDGVAAIHDTLAFNRAIEKAVDFYKKHPEDTIIVVTGDHECGGMTLGFAGTQYATNFEILSNQKISFMQFDNDVVKKFKAMKPTPGFDKIKPEITRCFGFVFNKGSDSPMALAPHEVNQISQAFDRSMASREEGSADSMDPQSYLLYGEYDPLGVTLTHILNQKAGIGWTSYQHTGVPVTTSAMGNGSNAFLGSYDNTDIALKMMAIMGFKAKPVHVSMN